MRILVLVISFVLFAACNGANQANNAAGVAPAKTPTPTAAPVYGYDVVATFPHDERAFTQGLVVHDGQFVESTGQYGESTIRQVEIKTGKVLKKKSLAKDYFAEGLTILGDRVFQITWRENIAFEYDLNFNLVREFKYAGEGWGLTNDGQQLIMSDGTHVIRFVDPSNFETVRTIEVKDEKGRRLSQLNELEYVKGEIWANIWHSEQMGKPNTIVRINPADGKVLGWLDLNGISPGDVSRDSENVLNGIAYDAANDRIFVTGKNWKNVYEIRLKSKS